MRILAADDSPTARNMVKEILSAEGHEVVLAEDGVDAVQMFYKERPDLVVLDIEMPKMNGYMVCRLLKDDPSARRVPVVILTSRDSASDRFWGQKSGANVYLSKRLMRTHLGSAVESSMTATLLAELGSEPTAPEVHRETDVLTTVCSMLEQRLFEATIVNDILALAALPMSQRDAAGAAFTSLRTLADFDLAGAYLVEDHAFAISAEQSLTWAETDGFVRAVMKRASHILGRSVAKHDVDLWNVGKTALDEESPVTRPWPSFVAMPLRIRGEVIAVVGLAATHENLFNESVSRALRLSGQPLATVFDSSKQYEKQRATEVREQLSALAKATDMASA